MFKKALLAGLMPATAITVQAAELPAYPFIHVSGSNELRVQPNLGQVDFEIAAFNADAARALQVVEGRVAEIRAVMGAAGIGADDLEIRDPRKDVKKGDPAVVAYEIRCGVKIIVRDLAQWKAVVGPLLAMQNLDGFMTGFDTTERAKVEAALMHEAIQTARRKGETIAAGFGRKLGPVSGVSVGELKNLTRSMNLTPSEFFQRARNPDAPPREEILMVTSLKLSQGVDVIFRIK